MLRFKPELPRNELQELYEKYNVPASATGTSRTCGMQVVWKQRSGNELEPVAVKIGITDYSFSQLMDGKLEKGDTVVTGQMLASSEGSQGSPLQPQRLRRRR